MKGDCGAFADTDFRWKIGQRRCWLGSMEGGAKDVSLFSENG